MINHPVAQTQRWVTVHRLDTDAQEDWDAVMAMLADAAGLEMATQADGSVTLSWAKPHIDGSIEDAGAQDRVSAPF